MQRPCARKEPAVPQALKGQGSLNASVIGEVEAVLQGLPCGALPCRPRFRFRLDVSVLGALGKDLKQVEVGLCCDGCLRHSTEELGFNGT